MNSWFTDGGRFAIVSYPTANANVYWLSPTEQRGYTELWVADMSNPETPAPMARITDYTQDVEFLACVFKTKPIPPFDPQYEYEVRCYVTCTYKVGASENPYAFTMRCRVAVVNTTLNTTVLDMTGQNWGASLNIYIENDVFIDGPYMYAYFGNDDATAGEDICGIGICGFRRNKADGTYFDVGSSIAQGGGCWISRKWMRENLGVDIYPEEAEPDPEEEDPNEDDDGYSGPGGGDGDHDHSTDDIGIPSLPTLSATGTGFVTLYKCNLAQIRAVAAELWTSTLWDLIKNLFTDPLQFIIGLAICPCTPDLLQGGYYPTIGNVLGQDVKLSTPLQVVSNQYKEIDCGTIQLNKYYGSALDYSPYEKIQIHLPYCGSHDLDVDEVMGSTIGVKYHCDVLTGACVAFVTITNDETTACVRYQYTGNIISHIPITERSFDEVVKSVAAMGAAAVGTLATAAGGGGAIGEGISSGEGGETDSVSMSANGGNVMTVKPNIMRTGTLSTALGLLACQKPFITRTIPRQSLPLNYKTYEGYPSNITETLGSLKGFTKIYSIRPNGFTCTADELDELVSLLKGGVIL